MDSLTGYGTDSDSGSDANEKPSTTVANTPNESDAASAEQAAPIKQQDSNLTPQFVEKAAQLQEKVRTALLKAEERGESFTAALQKQKEFRNPYWLSKVVAHFGILEVSVRLC